ncbi:hypothetical protein [Cupriavidus necator]
MLGDLDELVLKCRNDVARAHIAEAVRAYKAAAYRSSIVMTWVALAFDLADKLRELSLQGDAAATKRIEEYDRIHETNDVVASLRFERELLEVAKSEFELISEVELVDLARIQQDRNRCAHPSLNMDGEPFSPTAELARTHIRTAIEYVLQNEPAQGKLALKLVMGQVDGEYFPHKQDQVEAVLAHGPLRRGRKSLVRNFIKILLKKLLAETVDHVKEVKLIACLQAVKQMRADVWLEFFLTDLASVAKPVGAAEEGHKLLGLVLRLPEAWGALGEGVAVSLENYVRALPIEDLDLLPETYSFPPLKSAAEQRVKRLTPDDYSGLFLLSLPRYIWEHFIKSFCEAVSITRAKAWATVITSAHRFQPELLTQADADAVCLAVVNNMAVRRAPETAHILRAIYEAGLSRSTVWSHMIDEAEIDEAAISTPF